MRIRAASTGKCVLCDFEPLDLDPQTTPWASRMRISAQEFRFRRLKIEPGCTWRGGTCKPRAEMDCFLVSRSRRLFFFSLCLSRMDFPAAAATCAQHLQTPGRQPPPFTFSLSVRGASLSLSHLPSLFFLNKNKQILSAFSKEDSLLYGR
jgi:hypothetical protein